MTVKMVDKITIFAIFIHGICTGILAQAYWVI